MTHDIGNGYGMAARKADGRALQSAFWNRDIAAANAAAIRAYGVPDLTLTAGRLRLGS